MSEATQAEQPVQAGQPGQPTQAQPPVQRTAQAESIDMAHVSNGLLAALALAQGQMKTVEKDGAVKNKDGTVKYTYSTAEAMIRATREPMSANGLSMFSTWEISAPPTTAHYDCGKQYVFATVTESWVLAHESGGYLRGRAKTYAIGSFGRPPDKAIAAATTYLHGFVLRHLLNMDRDGGEDVHQRDDTDAEGPAPSGPPRATERKVTPLPEAERKGRGSKEGSKAAEAYQRVRKASEDHRALCKQLGRDPSEVDIARRAIGKEWAPKKGHSCKEMTAVADAIEIANGKMRVDVIAAGTAA